VNNRFIHRILYFYLKIKTMTHYIHQLEGWTNFTWDNELLLPKLATVRNLQGKLLGQMFMLGFDLKQEAVLETLTLDVLKTSEIESVFLKPEQVRSSIARHLGMDILGLIPSDRDVEGIVEMMLDATQNHQNLLTVERLFDWHAALFPSGRSGLYKITVGQWRTGIVQVISGGYGRERVHFQAPDASLVASEMQQFTTWFNAEQGLDPVLKAAIAHLWFITIHPFDDGNGRMARAITDMQLSRADGSSQRFYSMSAQIQAQRWEYYAILEKTQKGTSNISAWLLWFLDCLNAALGATEKTLAHVLTKAKFWEKYATMILNERQILMLNKLLGQFEGKLNTSKWAKMTKCSTDTALRDIQDLVAKGILSKDLSGGRSTNYGLNLF
jgi:Fic family protein